MTVPTPVVTRYAAPRRTPAPPAPSPPVPKKITWAALVESAPGLAPLLIAAQAAGNGDPVFCAYTFAADSLYPALANVLGSSVGPAWLHDRAAHVLAVRALWDALPGCRNCGCGSSAWTPKPRRSGAVSRTSTKQGGSR